MCTTTTRLERVWTQMKSGRESDFSDHAEAMNVDPQLVRYSWLFLRTLLHSQHRYMHRPFRSLPDAEDPIVSKSADNLKWRGLCEPVI